MYVPPAPASALDATRAAPFSVSVVVDVKAPLERLSARAVRNVMNVGLACALGRAIATDAPARVRAGRAVSAPLERLLAAPVPLRVSRALALLLEQLKLAADPMRLSAAAARALAPE